MNFSKIIEFLRSNEAVLIALFLCLLTQLSHSVIAYAFLSKESNDWINYFFGITFALAVSLSIIIFTLKGRKNLAYFFLAVEIFINLIYYRLYEIDSTYIIASTLFLCFIIPVTIASYSHEITMPIEERDSPILTEEQSLEIEEIKSTLASIQQATSKLEAENILNKKVTIRAETSSGTYDWKGKITLG